MKLLATLLIAGSLSFAACDRGGSEEPAATTAATETTRYTTRGTIERIEGARAEINHEEVPGYMPAMTMPFFANDEAVLSGLAAGDRIEFSFEVDDSRRHVIVSARKL
ncbi:MAG: copper-binding protein [Myxococcales bacterium]|nr:copper-binding protein [Myxococcales bacterium]